MRTKPKQQGNKMKDFKKPIAYVRVFFKDRETEPFSVEYVPEHFKENIWESIARIFLYNHKESFMVEILDSTLEKVFVGRRGV